MDLMVVCSYPKERERVCDVGTRFMHDCVRSLIVLLKGLLVPTIFRTVHN